MDTGIVFALVMSVLFLGGIFWLVVHARNQSQEHTTKTSIKPTESRHKDRAA